MKLAGLVIACLLWVVIAVVATPSERGQFLNDVGEGYEGGTL